MTEKNGPKLCKRWAYYIPYPLDRLPNPTDSKKKHNRLSQSRAFPG